MVHVGMKDEPKLGSGRVTIGMFAISQLLGT